MSEKLPTPEIGHKADTIEIREKAPKTRILMLSKYTPSEGRDTPVLVEVDTNFSVEKEREIFDREHPPSGPSLPQTDFEEFGRWLVASGKAREIETIDYVEPYAGM